MADKHEGMAFGAAAARERRFVDLHVHSTASDGQCTPEKIIALADKVSLAAVALTDHDTTAGLGAARDAAEKFADLKFVAGVEVSATCRRGLMHILGLGIDETDLTLQEMLERLRSDRSMRNEQIIEKLRAMGIDITLDEVRGVARENAGGGLVISRLHMAEALRRKGCAATIEDAFGRYIGTGAPAFVPKDKLTPAEVIAAISGAGGLAVLAHPAQLEYGNDAQLERIVRDLLDAGLDGIEAYHSSHTTRQTRLYLSLARKFEMVVTGGSDSHGHFKAGVTLGRPRVPLAVLSASTVRRLLK